jgi:hypothetical protein
MITTGLERTHPMELPSSFPNPQQNAKAIETLLARVRKLDRDARVRLVSMLDEEVDLPYLDVMEREYARAFQKIAPEHALTLRSRFVSALNEQREFLVDLVRKVLEECEQEEVYLDEPRV